MTDKSLLEFEKEAEKLRGEGKYAEAIDAIKKALEIDESFVRGHLALAVLYHNTNEHELSCQHAERACELEPNDAFNYAALSVTYQRAFEGTAILRTFKKLKWRWPRVEVSVRVSTG
ncbi:MAG: tetratricopeptide repeat protein [Pirellulaceae bacterium]